MSAPREGIFQIRLAPSNRAGRVFAVATSSYDPLPGETHRRGNDMGDGYTDDPETLATIIQALTAWWHGERT